MTNNTTSGNGADGIECGTPGAAFSSSCNINGSNSSGNGGFGLLLPPGEVPGTYRNSVFQFNGAGDVFPPFLDPGFFNLCTGGAPC